MSNTFRLALIPAAAMALAACGGGGGGGNDGPPSGSTTSSSGSAAKGIIIGGTVTALEISGGALVARGSAVTGTDGDYDLSIDGYGGGPLVIQIAGGTGAIMKCDVQAGCGSTPFGGEVPLDSGFVMRTILPSVVEGAALERCISPFTDLAARRAAERAGGNLANATAANATAALSEVSQLAGGIDVLRTCVVDLTDPGAVENADDAQLALSGLAAAVLAVEGGDDPLAALNTLGTNFAGGDIAAADLQELVDAAEVEVAAVSPGAETNVAYMSIEDDVEDADDGDPDTVDVVNPEPSEHVNQTAIEQGKALLDEVRSLALNLVQDEEVQDNAAIDAFANQLDAAGLAVENSTLGDDFGIAVEAAALFYESVADGESNQTQTLNSTDSGGVARTATITVSKPASGNHSVTVVGRVGDFTTNLSLSAPPDPTVGGDTPSDFTAALNGTMASASGNGLRAVLSGTAGATDLVYDAVTDRLDGASVNFDGTATFEQIGVSDPFRFEGNIVLDVVDCGDCAESVTGADGLPDDSETMNVDLFTFDGTFGNSKGSFAAEVSVDMDAASIASFDHRLPVSADNVPSGRVSVQLDAALDGFHEYAIAIVLDLNDITSLEGGANGDLHDVDATLTASLRRDGQTITVTGVSQTPTATANVVDVTIANQDGVRIVFDNLSASDTDPVSGAVFVGETPVGNVEETERGAVLIRWADGTFESLG